MSNVGARQVGEFMHPRHMVRSVRNTMDKSTIVSIYPKDIRESKETIQPGKFFIPAGTYKNPSVTIIGPSSWWSDRDIDQPLLEIPISATQMAHSIITDYMNGMLGCDMESAMPGLFFVDGERDLAEIKTKYSIKLVEAKFRQDNWYRILTQIADALWARSNGNPLVIWDEMRMAAKELGFETKPWIKDFLAVDMIRCFACGSLRNPEFPICSNCKNIDMEHPRAKEIKLAAGSI